MDEVIYVVVVYDQAAEPLRRIPEKELAVAEMIRDYFTDDLWKAVIYTYELETKKSRYSESG